MVEKVKGAVKVKLPSKIQLEKTRDQLYWAMSKAIQMHAPYDQLDRLRRAIRQDLDSIYDNQHALAVMKKQQAKIKKMAAKAKKEKEEANGK